MKLYLFSLILMATLLTPLVGTGTVTVTDCSAPSGAPGRLVEVIYLEAVAGDTVVFSCSGTITLTTYPIGIDKNLTIDGAGQSVTISGGNTVSVFVVYYGQTLNLQNITVANGAANGLGNGGGINNVGTLNVTNVTFSGNHAGWGGGGIANSGTLDVTDVIFSGNSATSHGGGIYNDSGTVTLTNVTFSANSAAAMGGAIFSTGSTATVDVTSSTFSGNSATMEGGGITSLQGTMNVANSTFSGNFTPTEGGGIFNAGTMSVTNSTFSGNSAASNGGGIYSAGWLNVMNSSFSGNGAGAGGGGIYGTGTLSVANSTFSNNSATFGGGIANGGGTLNVTNSTLSVNSAFNGGGIHNWGTLYVTNSTFSGNSTPGLTGDGGGIYNSAGMVIVTNSTISGNSAGADVGDAGGIRGPATLKNTIVANSTAGANCTGTITDGGGNLQFGGGAANSCGATIPTADPKLSALADNGGATQTMALGSGSAAIDAAVYATCMATAGSPNFGPGGLDQRGLSRASVNSVCDIGAFERQAGDSTALMVTDCSAPSGGAGRLVDVVNAAAAGDTVGFSCSGTITLTTTIILNKNLTMDGAGQSVTISGGNAVRVFTVNSGKTLNLQNLTVANGLGDGPGGGGVNNSGTLNVTNVAFSGNTSAGYGGGVYNWNGGTLTVTNSTFSGNSGSFGGGIANWTGSTLTVTNSTFSGNSGGWGGGISNWGGPAATTATITNNTFSGNTAGYGGGIYNWNGGTLTVTNSTFSGNSASQGGGIFGVGTLAVTNSTFAGNSSTAGGGAIESSSLTVKNSIIANSVSSQNCNNTLTDGGGNLQFGGTVANSCGATIPTADPRLSALANNGGPTQTMALLPDSPAINAASLANCPATDQRGALRGSICDIGAYEYLGIATGVVYPATGGTIVLDDGTFTITFPPNAVTTILTVTYTQALTPTNPLPNGRIGLRYFTLEARDGGGNLVTNFNQPYTLLLSYTDAELVSAGVAEATLNVSFWNGSAWVDMLPCVGCGIDAINNRVTIVANHFSYFAFLGQNWMIFLPAVVR